MRIPLITRSEIVFLLLAALYVGVSAAASYSHGLGHRFHALMYMERAALMTLLIGLCFFFYICLKALYILMAIRPKRPSKYIWKEWRKGPLDTERWLRAIPVFIGFLFFFSAFTSMKQLIPGFNPFTWDKEFAVLDRLLHFGIDPWRILYAPFSLPLLDKVYNVFTYALNINYNAWLIAVFAALYWQLFDKSNPVVRMQFFFAFLLTWAINGTLIATLFSSAGPCFLERLTGSAYYAPLMDQLNAANEHYKIFAVSTQDMIWNAASKSQSMVGGGISAMPSIHVSTALLFWLLARELNAKYQRLFMIFFVLIVIGSVFLAWHYAVDGYLSILTTYALWQLSGWMARGLAAPYVQQAPVENSDNQAT